MADNDLNRYPHLFDADDTNPKTRRLESPPDEDRPTIQELPKVLVGPRPLEWKDTVDIPFEHTRRLLVRFDERPGTWIFHCHILDHAEGGMLSAVHLALPIDQFKNMLDH